MTAAVVEHHYRPHADRLWHAFCASCRRPGTPKVAFCGYIRPADAPDYPAPTGHLCVVCVDLSAQHRCSA